MNKNLMIGLGVLAVAGIGLYVYNKRKKSSESKSEPKSKYTGLPTEEQIEKWRRGTRRFEDYYGAVGNSNLISAKQFYAQRGLALPSDLIAPAGMEYYTDGMPTAKQNCTGRLCLWKGENFCFCLKYSGKYYNPTKHEYQAVL